MIERLGFDNEKYLEMQSEHIRSRIDQFGGKLYLEFGGKLFDDNHASRVLPGFHPDSKIRMLMQLKDQVEIVVAVSAMDLEKSKVRGTWASPTAPTPSGSLTPFGALASRWAAWCSPVQWPARRGNLPVPAGGPGAEGLPPLLH